MMIVVGIVVYGGMIGMVPVMIHVVVRSVDGLSVREGRN